MAEESTRRLADIDWKEFDQVFLIALLLTGGVEEAEISMLEGMGAMDRAAGETTFLYSTIEAAVRQARSPVEEACAGSLPRYRSIGSLFHPNCTECWRCSPIGATASYCVFLSG